MRRLARWATVGFAAVGVAVGIVGFVGGAAPPTIHWQVDDRSAEPLSTVATGAGIRCTLDLETRAWVYAAAWHPARGCLALVPSESLRSGLADNPLPPGRHALPGTHLEKVLSWPAGIDTGPLSLLVIVSVEPLPDAERALRVMRQVGNAASPHQSALGSYAPSAGMDAVPRRSDAPPGVFGEAHGAQRLAHDGPMVPLRDGVWATTLRLRVALEPLTAESVEEQLRALERSIGSALTPPGSPH